MQVMDTFPTWEQIREQYPDIEAILFDMDGTLFPTETQHAQALHLLLTKLDKCFWDVRDLEKKFAGLSDEQVFEKIQPKTNLEMSAAEFVEMKNECFLINVKNADKLLRPEVKNLLDEVSQSELSLGLVTSSEKSVCESLLKKFKIHNLFDVILTREDTSENKPHPMPYLEAMKFLSLSPTKTLVFEDSNTGIQSATDSGAIVIQAKWFV
jgi:beta-phosphoglucomutase